LPQQPPPKHEHHTPRGLKRPQPTGTFLEKHLSPPAFKWGSSHFSSGGLHCSPGGRVCAPGNKWANPHPLLARFLFFRRFPLEGFFLAQKRKFFLNPKWPFLGKKPPLLVRGGVSQNPRVLEPPQNPGGQHPLYFLRTFTDVSFFFVFLMHLWAWKLDSLPELAFAGSYPRPLAVYFSKKQIFDKPWLCAGTFCFS